MTDADPFFELRDTLIPELPKAMERGRLGKALEDAATSVRNAEHWFVSMEALAAVPPDCIRDLPVESRASAEHAVTELEELGRWLQDVQDTEDLGRVGDRFPLAQNYVERLRDQFAQAWSKHLQTQFARAGPLGRLLALIADAATLGKELQQIAIVASGLAAQFPSGAAIVDTVNGLAAEFESAKQRLRDELGADDAVADFLLEASQGKVSLTRLTPEVRAWLDKHRATDLLHLELRS